MNGAAARSSSGPFSTTIVSGKPCSTAISSRNRPMCSLEFDDLPERYFAFLQDDVD